MVVKALNQFEQIIWGIIYKNNTKKIFIFYRLRHI